MFTFATTFLVVGVISSSKCFSNALLRHSGLLTTLFFSGSVALNAVLAVLITHKLLGARQSLLLYNNQLKHISRRYLTTIGVIVESASAWTIVGLVMIALRVTNSPAKLAFAGLFAITSVRPDTFHSVTLS
jgi:hypothetical protein